jgi:hypothetical protein
MGYLRAVPPTGRHFLRLDVSEPEYWCLFMEMFLRRAEAGSQASAPSRLPTISIEAAKTSR